MKFKYIISSIMIITLLSGCIGRVEKVTPAVQAGDDNLGCTQILESMVLNSQEAEKLIKEYNENSDTSINVKGVFIVFPVVFINSIPTPAEKARAFAKRNQVLAERYRLKNCSPKIEEYTENRILLDTNYSKLSTPRKQ
ncbi:MAG: hypothetical protein WC253_05645 [Sulfurovaceae bacterium]|nr:hypothetical protein [Sulfurovaceae bacterium]